MSALSGLVVVNFSSFFLSSFYYFLLLHDRVETFDIIKNGLNSQYNIIFLNSDLQSNK